MMKFREIPGGRADWLVDITPGDVVVPLSGVQRRK
jgi:hypothetical protein